MNDYFSIDAVITSYNRLDLLLIAIQSVVDQSVKVGNIIIVDDNSDFSENDFFAKISNLNNRTIEKILFRKNKTNKGACACRNLGASLSRAKLVAFLDDDDSWLPSHIETLRECFKIDDNLVLAYSGKNIIDYKSGKIRKSLSVIEPADQYNIMLSKNYPGSTSSIMVLREALEAVGGFDIHLPAIQDYDFYLRVCKLGQVSTNKQYTLNYRNDTPLKITNQLGKARIAFFIITSKFTGQDKRKISRTIYIQNIKKALRYVNFTYLFKYTLDYVALYAGKNKND